MGFIYHVTTRTVWGEALLSGEYRPLSLMTEGFIHCSTQAQVQPVLQNFYSYSTDLMLLVVDDAKIQSELRWEDPAHPDPNNPIPVADEEKFPHIYGALNIDAVPTMHYFPKGLADFLAWKAW